MDSVVVYCQLWSKIPTLIDLGLLSIHSSCMIVGGKGRQPLVTVVREKVMKVSLALNGLADGQRLLQGGQVVSRELAQRRANACTNFTHQIQCFLGRDGVGLQE